MALQALTEGAGDPVVYDDTAHAYYLRGERVPSVTQILTLTGRIDTRWFNDAAADRGRRVHAWAQRIDERAPIVDAEIPEEIGAEVEAYRGFVRDARPDYDGVERAFWHPILRYGGRPDRACRRLFGTRATLELKTGAEYDWHGLQLAGYERLRPVGARWAVYLQSNGRYKVRQHTRADDHQEFLRALRDVWSRWALTRTA